MRRYSLTTIQQTGDEARTAPGSRMTPTWLRLRWRRLLPHLLLLTLCVLLLICVCFRLVSDVPPPRTFHTYDINCSAIYEMEPVEVGRSLVIRRRPQAEDPDEDLLQLTTNCADFLRLRGYADVCVSKEEEDFPLAFSLVVHKSAWSVERLLRASYSPSNIYCIHYDLKSSVPFVAAMRGLARCLPNVFIASRLEDVFYAHVSRLRADLSCLRDLLRSEVRWRYAINLCGQDFPLRSNMELVSELQKVNGANMLESCRPTELKKERFTFRYQLTDALFEYDKIPVRTDQEKPPPPHDIEIFTGNAYFILSRDFVLHLNSSVEVQDFLSWSEDTYSPDEHFWATLVRVPGVPGEVPRSQGDITDLMSRTRLVKWEYLEEQLYPPCTGTHVRSVCIFGAAELRWLLNFGHLFANKVDARVDPVLVQCLEEKLQERQKLFQSMTRLACPGRRPHGAT